jgi:hypothetical protein
MGMQKSRAIGAYLTWVFVVFLAGIWVLPDNAEAFGDQMRCKKSSSPDELHRVTHQIEKKLEYLEREQRLVLRNLSAPQQTTMHSVRLHEHEQLKAHLNNQLKACLKLTYSGNAATVSTNTPHSDIDMTPASSVQFSGTIGFPDGLTNSTDITVQVRAYDYLWNQLGYTSATIAAVTNSVSFDIDLDPDETVFFEYSLLGETDQPYVNWGLYGGGGTMVTNPNDAATFSTNTPRDDIYMTLIPAVRFSGTIGFPDGLTNSADISIQVSAYDSSQTWIGLGSTSVTIPAITNSAPFELDLPADEEVIFRYYFWEETDQAYAQQGYYGGGGAMVSSSDDAATFSTNVPRNDIYMTLIPAARFSGTIGFPDGLTNSANISVQISASDLSYNQLGYTYTTIAAGTNSASFELDLPSDEEVFFEYYFSDETDQPYVQRGYFGGDGTMVSSSDDAAIFSTNTPRNDIYMTLIPAARFSGTIGFPDGLTNSANISVQISASDLSYNQLGYTYTTIAAGTNSASFELDLPPDEEVIFQYYFGDETDQAYAQQGYYGGGGAMVSSSDDAATFSTNVPRNDIYMTLIPAARFSGTIGFPDGLTNSANISVQISASDLSYNQLGYTYTTIAAGTNSASFELDLPPDEEVFFQYYFGDETDQTYMQQGYYGGGGAMVRYSNDAATFSTNVPRNDIYMTLIPAARFSGTIGFPDGLTNSANISVQISASDLSYNQLGYTYTTIAAGTNSASFELDLPPDEEVIFQYYFGDETDQTYAQQGYYGGDGTMVRYSNDAATFSTNVPRNDIYMTLIPAVRFSGTISRPPGASATEVLNGSIQATNDLGNILASDWFEIPAGAAQSDWELTLADEGYSQVALRMQIYRYPVDPGQQYLNGFYTSSGPVGLFENAQFLDGTQDQENLALTVLQGNEVSGSLYLQGTDVFPTDGGIYLWAEWDGIYDPPFYPNYYTIADYQEGAGSVEYALFVPPDLPDYKIRYSFYNAFSPYVGYGYYNPSMEAMCAEDGAFLTAGFDYPNTAITLADYYQASGTISLPAGMIANGDLPISLGTIDSSSTNLYATSLGAASVTIYDGTASSPYSLVFPYNCSGDTATYFVGYDQPEDSYVRNGFYAANGTVGYAGNADELADNQDHTGIDLDLLVGSVISGTASLPSGDTAGPEGLPITFGIHSEPTGYYHTTVTLPENASAAPYTVRVAPDFNEVALGYWLPVDAPYAQRGYFAQAPPDNTTGRLDFAARFDVNQDSSGNDFTTSVGQDVSGTIFVPAPLPEPLPVWITIAADPQEPESVYWHTLTSIPSDNDQISYEQRVILDSDVVVGYRTEGQGLSPFGYYDTPVQSTRIPAEATVLTQGQNHPDINLHIEELFAGDLNNDGSVDLVDAVLGLRILTGQTVSMEVVAAADVDGDGVLGLAEVMYILAEMGAN